MWALTILSYDSDLSKNNKKTAWLIEMHRVLVQAVQYQFKAKKAKDEEKDAVAFYFENLKRLSEETKRTILGEMGLPRVKAVSSTKASHSHQVISEGLKRKFAENNKDFIVIDEESGLESGILPMDITIKDASGKRIIAFIEIDGPDHFLTREDGQRVPQRRDQLREELYKFNHPGIPLLRIDLMRRRGYEEYSEELYEKIMMK
jgi:hypothetical protein